MAYQSEFLGTQIDASVDRAKDGETFLEVADLGAPFGVAPLDADGKVPQERIYLTSGAKVTDTRYQISESGTEIPEGEWTEEVPTIPSGWFLWVRLEWDTNQFTYYPVRQGQDGGSVSSVNGQTGDVVLDAEDIGADPAGTGASEAASAVSTHNASSSAHASLFAAKANASDLNTKANLASPTFTGTPKAPTAAAGTSNTQLATTAFVQNALSGIQVDPAYPLTITSSTTRTLQPNTATFFSGTPTSLNLTLAAPSSTTDSEYRISFLSGSSFSMSVTAPSGYKIVYPTEPSWQAGHWYEVSFMRDADSIIVCLVKDCGEKRASITITSAGGISTSNSRANACILFNEGGSTSDAIYQVGTTDYPLLTTVYIWGKTGRYNSTSHYIYIGVKLNGTIVGSTTTSSQYGGLVPLYTLTLNGDTTIKLVDKGATSTSNETIYVEITQ